MSIAPKKPSRIAKPVLKLLTLASSCLLLWHIAPKILPPPTIAFFYGKPMPIEFLQQFDEVVLEPDHISDITPLIANGVTVFAYLSVGEINPSRAWYADIPKNWLLGTNNAWGSSIVDLSNKGWHKHLINKQMAALWDRGYRGFFLDTLDSYQLIANSSADKLIQKRALIELIRDMHQHFPGIKLIINRGFEILPEIAAYTKAVVAESLFESWNAPGNQYKTVPEADFNWLLAKLDQAHDEYGLQIIVIDYVPANQHKLAKQVASRIDALGFTPWVSTPAMDMQGIGKQQTGLFWDKFCPLTGFCKARVISAPDKPL